MPSYFKTIRTLELVIAVLTLTLIGLLVYAVQLQLTNNELTNYNHNLSRDRVECKELLKLQGINFEGVSKL